MGNELLSDELTCLVRPCKLRLCRPCDSISDDDTLRIYFAGFNESQLYERSISLTSLFLRFCSILILHFNLCYMEDVLT